MKPKKRVFPLYIPEHLREKWDTIVSDAAQEHIGVGRYVIELILELEKKQHE